MAAKEIYSVGDVAVRQYIGLDADKASIDLTKCNAGSTFMATDTGAIYISDGTQWVAM